MSLSTKATKMNGFTLIELLVVIAIISILASILIPSLTLARDLAKNATCVSNLRSMGIGFGMYANDFGGRLPAGYDGAIKPSWWPYYAANSGFLAQPHGYGEGSDRGEGRMWLCPVAEREAQSMGASHVSWTYVRVRNRAWWWSLGMGGWANVNDCDQPGVQLFVIESLLLQAEVDREPTAAKAGALNGAMVAFDHGSGIIGTGGSGGAGFIHPGERANALHPDWHVESYSISEITVDMCEEPY